MTVKELLQHVDFNAIAEALVKKYPKDSLLTMQEYKENYHTLCHLDYNGEGGSITFQADGDSDAYMIEGYSFENIVGMEVILPDDCDSTKVETAAEILWCSGPFGNWTGDDWKALHEELINPSKLSPIKFRIKQIGILISLPYCKNKKMRRELRREFKRPFDEMQISHDTFRCISERNRNLNRSKRKREYRLKNRLRQLLRENA